MFCMHDKTNNSFSGDLDYDKWFQNADCSKRWAELARRNAEPGGCECGLTLKLPRSGITQTVLIQDGGLKNGCRQWDGDGWTRLTLALARGGEEGVKQLGLSVWHLHPLCVQVQTSVRHLGWQQEAAVFRGNFLFLSAGLLWCGSGMALMAFFTEEWNEVSVETGNLELGID